MHNVAFSDFWSKAFEPIGSKQCEYCLVISGQLVLFFAKTFSFTYFGGSVKIFEGNFGSISFVGGWHGFTFYFLKLRFNATDDILPAKGCNFTSIVGSGQQPEVRHMQFLCPISLPCMCLLHSNVAPKKPSSNGVKLTRSCCGFWEKVEKPENSRKRNSIGGQTLQPSQIRDHCCKWTGATVQKFVPYLTLNNEGI